jgi:hypothetical protein
LAISAPSADIRPVIRTPHAQRSPALIDPGWLFLLAGMGILAATVLIPAAEDLSAARFQRDRALLIEAHRIERLGRYEEYLSAIDNKDPSLILSLAESQLNQIPEGRAPIAGARGALGANSDVSVFPSLEPPPLALPTRRKTESTLERLTTNDHARLWLIAAGAACVLIGLFPASNGWGHPGRRHPYL